MSNKTSRIIVFGLIITLIITSVLLIVNSKINRKKNEEIQPEISTYTELSAFEYVAPEPVDEEKLSEEEQEWLEITKEVRESQPVVEDQFMFDYNMSNSYKTSDLQNQDYQIDLSMIENEAAAAVIRDIACVNKSSYIKLIEEKTYYDEDKDETTIVIQLADGSYWFVIYRDNLAYSIKDNFNDIDNSLKGNMLEDE